MGRNSKQLPGLTAIIKTFERPGWLDRMIRSIRRYYPDLPILVADDSFEPVPRDDVGYLRLPPDVGISAGRNALLARVETPYFLLLDDDFEFTRRTRIERLLRVVRETSLPLAGGHVVRCKRRIVRVRRPTPPYYGMIEREGDILAIRPGCRRDEGEYLVCDLVSNFFVARTDVVRAMGGWDEELKLNEHGPFFVELHGRGHEVAFCPDVEVLHWAARPRGYARYRGRDYLPLAARKMGVREWTGMDGQVYRFPDKRAA